MSPEQMWENFTKALNEKSGFENVNMLGSVESYKKIFLEANAPKGVDYTTCPIEEVNYMDPCRSWTGDKVIFHGRGGYDYQKEDALKAGLIPGNMYTVKKVDVYDYSSEVFLQEIPGRIGFNSVLFAPA